MLEFTKTFVVRPNTDDITVYASSILGLVHVFSPTELTNNLYLAGERDILEGYVFPEQTETIQPLNDAYQDAVRNLKMLSESVYDLTCPELLIRQFQSKFEAACQNRRNKIRKYMIDSTSLSSIEFVSMYTVPDSVVITDSSVEFQVLDRAKFVFKFRNN